MEIFNKIKGVFRSQNAPMGQRRNPKLSMRFFDGAKTGRLESSWKTTPATIDARIYKDLTTLVARSIDQAENNDFARKYIQLLKDNVAGPKGFHFSSNVRDPNGDSDTLASKAIETAFAEFSKKGNFDVTGSLSRCEIERMMAGQIGTHGESIIVFRVGNEFGKYKCAVQVIDPYLLDPSHYVELSNGNIIKHGVEVNQYGKPVRYHFRRHDNRQHGYVPTSGALYDVVDAKHVMHFFFSEHAGQKRGLPGMRTALWKMNMLKGFEDAVLVNARVGASKMGFFRDPDGTNDEEEIPMEGDPGTFEDIGNREFVDWSPQFPEQTIESFMRSMLRSQAAGLNIGYNNYGNDLTSVNFSSIRQGALDERSMWRGMQNAMIESWCNWIFEKWLEIALLTKAISVKGSPLPIAKIDKFKSCSWQGRTWDWIDPNSEIAANEKAIALRIKSRSSVISELTGRDPEDVWNEISSEDKYMSTLGVVPELMAGSPGLASTPNNSTQNV